MTVGLAVAATLFAACAPAPMDDAEVLSRALGPGRTFVDLSHPLSGDMPFWPNPAGNPFVHDTLVAQPSGAPAMAAYSTPEHHGTHLDAPIHGGDGLASVDELGLSRLIGPAVVVDVTQAVESDLDYALSVADLQNWEARHGPIPTGAIVLMRSGWSARWSEPARVFNVDDEGVLHFPGFSTEAAQFLVEQRNVVGIGVDSPSVDPGPSTDFPIHAIGNGSGLYHLENVADLERLPEAGAWLMSLPIKIEGGSGGQVRVVGVLPGPAT